MSSSTPGLSNFSLEELIDQFSNGSLRKRRSLIGPLADRAEEISKLGPKILSAFDPAGDDWAAGWILQVVQGFSPEALTDLVPSGPGLWFEAASASGIDYSILQKELLSQRFEEADRFTSSVLRKLAGTAAEARGYVYFTEVRYMPELDLTTIDRLWTAFSQGRFGFSRQASLLKSLNGSYERLWPKIGWKEDGVWTRYPGSFTWSIEAPEGHMPLINQLRGVRLMDAILTHPALRARDNSKS